MISAAARKRRIAASPAVREPEPSSSGSTACCALRLTASSPLAASVAPAIPAVFRNERRWTIRFNVELTFSPVDGAAVADNSVAGTFFVAISHLPILLELFRLEIQFVNSNYLA